MPIEICRYDLISAWSFLYKILIWGPRANRPVLYVGQPNCCNAVRLLACLLHRGYLTPRRSRQTQLIYLSRIRGSCQEQANRRFSPCNSTIARAMAAANCFLCGISSQCWSYTTSYTLMELDYASSWFKPDCAHQQNILVIAQWDCGWYGWYISSPST